MKKLFSVLVLMLALNFLAAGGAVGWLYQSGRLDKTKIAEIRSVLFPPAVSGRTGGEGSEGSRDDAAHVAAGSTDGPADRPAGVGAGGVYSAYV